MYFRNRDPHNRMFESINSFFKLMGRAEIFRNNWRPACVPGRRISALKWVRQTTCLGRTLEDLRWSVGVGSVCDRDRL